MAPHPGGSRSLVLANGIEADTMSEITPQANRVLQVGHRIGSNAESRPIVERSLDKSQPASQCEAATEMPGDRALYLHSEFLSPTLSNCDQIGRGAAIIAAETSPRFVHDISP